MDRKAKKAEEHRGAVPARKAPTPTTKGGEVPRFLDELRASVARAQGGDAEASRRVRGVLEETPRSEEILSNIVAKQAERVLVEKMSGDLLLREALSLRLAAMRKEVAGRDPSPLERLLAERVVACWLQLQHAEAIHVNGLGKHTMSQSEYHQRRLDKLHRRFLAAIRALAQVRKLLTPAVTQINVAEQQVNVAAEHPRHDS